MIEELKKQPVHILSASFLTTDEQKIFFKQLTKEMLNSRQKELSIIYHVNQQIAYLTVNNYLFTKLFGNQQQKQQACEIFQLLQLDPLILKKRFAELTYYEAILVQIVHSLLQKKKYLILTDFFDKLSIPQIQNILPLLKKVIVHYELSLTLITHDQRLKNNPLIDQILVLTQPKRLTHES